MFRLQKIAEEADTVRLRAEGELGQSRLPSDGDGVTALLGEAGFGRAVLLDLAGCDFLDSAGISWLIALHRRCAAAGGVLVLVAPAPRVAGVLRSCHLDTVLHLAADEAAARALARQRGTG